MTEANNYKTPVYIAALIFLIWGILGVMDFKNFTRTGYSTDGNNKITEVESSSPAEDAGLQVGDLIRSIGGISVEDVRAQSRQPRTHIGDTKSFVVERNGEEVSLDLTYGEQTGSQKMNNYLAFVVGLIFLISGLWVFGKNKARAGLLFTMFALAFGSTFFNGPYIASPGLSDIVGAIFLVIVLIGFAFLLHFLLQYPEPKAMVSRKSGLRIIYAPAAILSVIFLGLIFLKPDATSGLNVTIRTLIGLFVLIYFGWSLVALVQSYSKSSSAERSRTGLSLMLFGAVIGLLPLLIIIAVNLIAPSAIVPGSDYAFLLMGLIPICFAVALTRSQVVAE